MIIQTLDKAYEVIKKFEENSERAVYLCRIPGDASGSSYLVTAFNSEQVPREHVIYFMELSVKQQTEDFEECFLKNGFLYLVFRHQEERKLRNELGEEEQALLNQYEYLQYYNLFGGQTENGFFFVADPDQSEG